MKTLSFSNGIGSVGTVDAGSPPPPPPPPPPPDETFTFPRREQLLSSERSCRAPPASAHTRTGSDPVGSPDGSFTETEIVRARDLRSGRTRKRLSVTRF